MIPRSKYIIECTLLTGKRADVSIIAESEFDAREKFYKQYCTRVAINSIEVVHRYDVAYTFENSVFIKHFKIEASNEKAACNSCIIRAMFEEGNARGDCIVTKVVEIGF